MEAEIAIRPSLIPVALRSPGSEVVWLDLNAFHCSHGFFHESLSVFRDQTGEARAWFLSPFESLMSSGVTGGCLPPSAFIFHASRTGSTLLAKALARSRSNLVFSEANVHNQIWNLLPAAGCQRFQAYRALLTAMGRRRLPSYQSHIVKFSSWNIAGYSTIREAFPGVPTLFLYREPGEILESLRREPPGWVGQDTGIGVVWKTPEEALDSFFQTALSIDEPNFRCLDYRDFTPDSLPAIASLFGLNLSPPELADMKEEFLWDAKSGINPKKFAPPPRDISPAPEALRQLYEALRSYAPLIPS